MTSFKFFGDSYLAPEYDSNIVGNKLHGVANSLASAFDLPHRNYAAHGSCLEFSVKNLVHRLGSGEVKPGEIIVFCITTIGRLALKSTCEINCINDSHFPPLASAGSGFLQYDLTMDNPPSQGNLAMDDYVRKHQKELLWYVLEQDYSVVSLVHKGLVLLLLNIAREHPDKKFIFMKTAEMDDIQVDDLLPKNALFFPIDISEIAQKEIHWSKDMLSFFKRKRMSAYNMVSKYTGSDPRTNHLTLPNQSVFVADLKKGIENWNFNHVSLDNYKLDYFKVPETSAEFLESVKAGLLPDRHNYTDKYKK